LDLWERDRVYFYIYVFSGWDEVIDLVLSSEGKLNFHDALLVVGARRRNLDRIVSFDTNFDGYSERIG